MFAGIVDDRSRHSNAPRLLRPFRAMKHVAPGHLDIVRTVRDARFASGSFCPHCDSRAVVRWGGFSGRQRYRCRSCSKTFSDLTRTAFAYTKCIGKWPHYLILMRQGRTLRVSAARLRIHVSTAFRWRHAILSLAKVADTTTLAGTVEVKELRFAHSRKGSRRVHAPRERGARLDGWRWNQVPHDTVLLAFSRSGVAHSSTVGGDVVVADAIRDWTLARLDGRCTVFAYSTWAGPVGSPIRAAGHDYHMLRVIANPNGLSSGHTSNVDAYGRRLMDWLERFRGVASRYRDNYLHWHRRIDADYDLLWAHGLIAESTQPRAWDIRGRRGTCTDRPP